MESITIKQCIDKGAELTIRFQAELTDNPTIVSLVKTDNGNYLIHSHPYIHFTTSKFDNAWLYFSQFTDPCRNVSIAISMARELYPFLNENPKHEIDSYRKLIKANGWCTTSTWF